MIYVREIVPRKMPGLSSFLVSFAFNPVIVDTLKTLPLYYYHKSDQA
jgi:hypothetical protein